MASSVALANAAIRWERGRVMIDPPRAVMPCAHSTNGKIMPKRHTPPHLSALRDGSKEPCRGTHLDESMDVRRRHVDREYQQRRQVHGWMPVR
ncbi:hypothetical protein [Kibdelosporangium philippinense]|uniref:hypothetical protein n=1 Tax=Kibdelosporangium philippinense TaxID=211113 RepID=UPI00362299E3